MKDGKPARDWWPMGELKEPTSDQWFRAFVVIIAIYHEKLGGVVIVTKSGGHQAGDTSLAVAWLNVELLKDQQMRGAITA
jgi:hypothetical protein